MNGCVAFQYGFLGVLLSLNWPVLTSANEMEMQVFSSLGNACQQTRAFHHITPLRVLFFFSRSGVFSRTLVCYSITTLAISTPYHARMTVEVIYWKLTGKVQEYCQKDSYTWFNLIFLFFFFFLTTALFQNNSTVLQNWSKSCLPGS